jgi:hypothetical protein
MYPPGVLRSPMTERLLASENVIWTVDLRPSLVTAISRQILVRTADVEGSSELATELEAVGARPVGRMLDGADVEMSEADRNRFDVDVWSLEDDFFLDPFHVMSHMKRNVQVEQRPFAAVPHHVLVPSNWAYCPAGPPHATRLTTPIDQFEEGGSVDVVAIDSGYIEHPRLEERGGVTSQPGHYLDASGTWKEEPLDEVDDFPSDGLLDAVAGHGTFVAGVIAAKSPRARITIIGHRHVDSTGTTEVAVGRSMFEAVSRHVREGRPNGLVIGCGFSFRTHSQHAPVAFESVLEYIDDVGCDAVIVAPAGNEGVDTPHWPAAFAEVVGVGALREDGTDIASFSNRGDWVDCFAIGENVVSTHVTTAKRMAPEDDPSAPQLFTGWSRWSGTSFAAPKVAAEIARRAEGAGSVSAATKALLADATGGYLSSLG